MTVPLITPITPADTSALAVRVEGLSLRYASHLALDDLSLSVARGSNFALLGPNGAGKSSLMSVLATLLKPGQGLVQVAGFDVRRQSRQVRQSIGMVFQDHSLDDRLSAEENLDFHGRVYGMPAKARAEAIDRMLALVELEDWREASVRSFSGGMKRRLEIARALMHGPQILFLDEPTVGLDAQSRHRIWDYLRQEQRARGLTLFTTTHYIEEVDGADHVCIVDKGRIIAEGTPDSLKRDLGQAFIHVTPRSIEDRAALQASYPLAHALDGQGLAIPSDGPEFAADFLAKFGNRLSEIRFEAPTLEGVFLKLTGRVLRDRAEAGAKSGGRKAGRR